LVTLIFCIRNIKFEITRTATATSILLTYNQISESPLKLTDMKVIAGIFQRRNFLISVIDKIASLSTDGMSFVSRFKMSAIAPACVSKPYSNCWGG